MNRILCWFSCGAASAVATKKTIDYFSDTHEVIPVCCDTRPSEQSDNYRFSADCERWFGKPITYIRNEDYATVDEVFEKTKYMAGVNGARCTTELKKVPRLAFQRPDDIHVFGYTAYEHDRVEKFRAHNPEIRFKWILKDLAGFAFQKCTILDSITTIVRGVLRRQAHGIGIRYELTSLSCSNAGANNLDGWV